MGAIGSRTSGNPVAVAPPAARKNTASKIPLNSLDNDAIDFLLPALSRLRPEIPPRGSPDARTTSATRDMRYMCATELFFGHFGQYIYVSLSEFSHTAARCHIPPHGGLGERGPKVVRK